MNIVTQDNQVPEEALLALGVTRKIDEMEASMLEMEPAECPNEHFFTPGIYTRSIFMPAGTLIVSKIHKTQHPYFILKGAVSVWIDGVGVQNIKAPFFGVTEPGTRRVLYIHEDCYWITTHANPDNENVEQIEARIIEPHINPFIQTKQEEILNEV